MRRASSDTVAGSSCPREIAPINWICVATELASKRSEGGLAREQVVVVPVAVGMSGGTIVSGVVILGVRSCGIRINVLTSLFSGKD